MAERGRVLWFDINKGFGFIRRIDGTDCFVHFSKILEEPGVFRVLEENDEVEFEVFFSDRGNGQVKPQAKNVKKVEGGISSEVSAQQ